MLNTTTPRKIAFRIWLVIFTGLTFYALWQTHETGIDNRNIAISNRKLAVEGKEAHDSLCIIRVSLDKRIKRTQELLAQYPEPKIFKFIPRKLIRQSLNEDMADRNSLSLLKCIPPPKKPKKSR